MKKNNIDAVKLVRKIRDKHYNDIKGKSKKEILEYYKKKAEEFNSKNIPSLTK